MNKFWQVYVIDYTHNVASQETGLFTLLAGGWEIQSATGGDRYTRFLMFKVKLS